MHGKQNTDPQYGTDARRGAGHQHSASGYTSSAGGRGSAPPDSVSGTTGTTGGTTRAYVNAGMDLYGPGGGGGQVSSVPAAGGAGGAAGYQGANGTGGGINCAGGAGGTGKQTDTYLRGSGAGGQGLERVLW